MADEDRLTEKVGSACEPPRVSDVDDSKGLLLPGEDLPKVAVPEVGSGSPWISDVGVVRTEEEMLDDGVSCSWLS